MSLDNVWAEIETLPLETLWLSVSRTVDGTYWIGGLNCRQFAGKGDTLEAALRAALERYKANA